MIGDKKNNPNKVSNSYEENMSQNCHKDCSSDHTEQSKNCTSKKDNSQNCSDCDKTYEVEPLPESFRPRKDGPGGN